MWKMLEEPCPSCSLQQRLRICCCRKVQRWSCVRRDGGRVVSVFACGSFLHPPVRRSPPCTAQRSHGATFIPPVIGPRSPGSSHHWATPGKQPSNSQTSHYHNIHPIRLHTFTIKTDTFTDACIIIHKDQTSFDTLDSTLEKWHIIDVFDHACRIIMHLLIV